ncbi:MAG: hypothetical protein H0T15_00560 [Thermoleophilaceae bacterium]|nr:hypothetical protein [Thermoleophilaceae bacterium]
MTTETQATETEPERKTETKTETETKTREEGDPPAKVEPYTCNGKKLSALRGPRGAKVTVRPSIVEPGQRFEVRVVGVSEARVNLAGVSDKPFGAEAKPDGNDAVASLTMPANAPCGNKLITVEGEISDQASIAVGTRP